MSNYVMTAAEFVEKLKMCAELPSLYVKGGFGHTASESNKQRLINQYSYNARRADLINSAVLGTFFYDCCGLGKAIAWGFKGDPNLVYGGAVYKSNGVPDEDETAMMNSCLDISTDFSEIMMGEALGISGHIGFYVGNGQAIECTPAGSDDVQYSWVANIVGNKPNELTRLWQRHGKLPWVDYGEQPTPPVPPEPKPGVIVVDGSWGFETTKYTQIMFGTNPDSVISNQPWYNKRFLPNAYKECWQFHLFASKVGSDLIRAIQTFLRDRGYYYGDIDGWCGKQTVMAIQAFLADCGYYTDTIDGSMGYNTVCAWQTYVNSWFKTQ